MPGSEHNRGPPLPQSTPRYAPASQEQRSLQRHLMSPSVESLSSQLTWPTAGDYEDAAVELHAAVVHVGYLGTRERQLVAAPDAQRGHTPRHNTVDHGRNQDTPQRRHCRPRTRKASKFPTDTFTPRTRKSDPFSRQLARDLRNANVALSRQPRDRQRRHGVRDRAFNPISELARLSILRSKDQKTGDSHAVSRRRNLATDRALRHL